MSMRLDAGIPVSIGKIKGFVFGGPFKKYVPGTRRLVGVKMAAEIHHPHEVSIPTEDFSIPDEGDMQAGLILALEAMLDGNDVYVGCMGGIGRTGLFMGCMAKLMQDCADAGYEPVINTGDPVQWVRGNYVSHAIETREQKLFVRHFNTTPIVEWLETVHKVQVKEVEVPRVEYPGILQYIRHLFLG